MFNIRGLGLLSIRGKGLEIIQAFTIRGNQVAASRCTPGHLEALGLVICISALSSGLLRLSWDRVLFLHFTRTKIIAQCANIESVGSIGSMILWVLEVQVTI